MDAGLSAPLEEEMCVVRVGEAATGEAMAADGASTDVADVASTEPFLLLEGEASKRRGDSLP